jgi:amidophosphoribosyltransferase
VREIAHIEGKPRCNCGIFGIYGHSEAAVQTYYGLHALQHRGQEATGIVTRDFEAAKQRYRFNLHRAPGLVSDVFKDARILSDDLRGNAAIGHNRYSTTGSADNMTNIQPFVVNYRQGHLAVAHNGNLTNFRQIRQTLQDRGTIFQSTSDTEVILHLVAQSRQTDQIQQIKEALETVEGAFSLVMLTDKALIAARDPHGFRPLALGKLGTAYVVASETVSFDLIGAEYICDVEPGEILVIDDEAIASGTVKSYHLAKKAASTHHCIFEYIYFSRPDSKVFGENVDKVRRKLGKLLAQESPVTKSPTDERVVVISVPDSSNTATLGFVSESQNRGHDVKLELGLIRSHYVGRTFIAPTQNSRELKVKTKFNTVKGVLQGRKVVIIDDSIVRGTTSRQLVKLVKEAGPKEVHVRITSPPIKYPCHFGMDFPSRDELIANKAGGDVERIREFLDVDSLSYLSLEKLLEAAPAGEGRSYCTACFSGVYPAPIDGGASKDANDV